MAVDRVASVARAVDDLEGDGCVVGDGRQVGRRVDVPVDEAWHAEEPDLLEDVDVVERGVARLGIWRGRHKVDDVGRALASAKADAQEFAL